MDATPDIPAEHHLDAVRRPRDIFAGDFNKLSNVF
jgi:hypothetical protein